MAGYRCTESPRRSAVLTAVVGCVVPFSILGAIAVGKVQFSERLIADKYGYTFGVCAVDLDGDGDIDLTNVDIVGKNPSAASLFWFENNGQGGFERHVLHDRENGWLEL